MANNEVRRIIKRQWSLADHAGDFSPAAGSSLEQGSQVDVQLDLNGVSDSAYREGAKMDFSVDGSSNELVDYCDVIAALEFASAPTAGEACYLYMAWSPDATAANGNPAGAVGSDQAYDGYSTNGDAAIKQTELVAVFVVTAQGTTTVQIIHGGSFTPKERYACPIFRNESAVGMVGDGVEQHIVINGYVDEVQ